MDVLDAMHSTHLIGETSRVLYVWHNLIFRRVRNAPDYWLFSDYLVFKASDLFRPAVGSKAMGTGEICLSKLPEFSTGRQCHKRGKR